MSDPKPPSDFPVDKRRGAMDTLFSAPWFDDADGAAPAEGGSAASAAPTEEVPSSSAAPSSVASPASTELAPVAPSSNSKVLLIVVGVVALLLVPSLMCGVLGLLGGAYYYVTLMGM